MHALFYIKCEVAQFYTLGRACVLHERIRYCNHATVIVPVLFSMHSMYIRMYVHTMDMYMLKELGSVISSMATFSNGTEPPVTVRQRLQQVRGRQVETEEQTHLPLAN